LGKGDGTFDTSTPPYQTTGPVAGVAAGDFNGDGLTDLVACTGRPSITTGVSPFPNDTVSVFLNTSRGPISGAHVGGFDPATATWYLRGSPGPSATDVPAFQFGGAGWTPVVGDWGGNGTATVGVVDPATMTWYLRNSNSPGSPDYAPFAFGLPGWVPVVGDWTGSGHTGIGAFDPATATWYLRNEVGAGASDAGVFRYGAPGWTPVVGDWDGNGTATVGVVDPATMTWYLRDSNSPGAPDVTPFRYGAIGWKPVVGDWASRGRTTIGVVDQGTMTWYLRNENSGGGPDVTAPFAYGQPGWVPLAGHFGGTVQTGIGMFDPSTATWYLRNEVGGGAPDTGVFQYGAPGWIPVVGDWAGGTAGIGNGYTGIGVVDPATMTWYLRNEASPGPPDAGIFQYGAPGWVPVVGHWVAPNYSPGHFTPTNTGIGVFDPATATWYLRNEDSAGPPDAGVKQFGAPGWLPVENGWLGSSQSVLTVVDPSTMTWYVEGSTPAIPFQYGGVGWRPVMGDWNGDGMATVGALDPNGFWRLSNQSGFPPGVFIPPDIVPFSYGLGSWVPLVGHWLGAGPAGSPRAADGPALPQPLDGSLASLRASPDELFAAGLG
jgi:hypothetical protein